MRVTTAIPVISDNLAYVVEDAGKALVIDPGEASPVLRRLREAGSMLLEVVLTHDHFDHTAGSDELVATTGCELVGVPRVGDAGETTLHIGPFTVMVLSTPGHSEDSVCYYLPPSGGSAGAVFTGDTLFVGGCGRLFTHSPETMWASFQRLASLPPETLVYCGHDYSLENYEFALTVEPDNEAVRHRLEEMRALAESVEPAVPSTMAEECATNPFLRVSEPVLKRALGMPDVTDVDVFAELRRRKDCF